MSITFELKPTDSHVSFWNKARVIDAERYVWLESYNTIVCGFNKRTGNFHRTWPDYSATTMRHINSFRETYRFAKITKKEWESMPVKHIKH